MTVPTMLAPGAAIPQPPDFRVYFEPGEDRLLWDRDRTHHPAQLTTLEGEFVARFAAHGMGHAFARYAVPVAGVRARAIHGYLYTAFEPLQGSPEDIARHAARGEAAILATVARLQTAWEDEWLPEILEHLGAMEAADPRRAPSTVGLVDILEDYWEHMERLVGAPLRDRVPGVRRGQRVRRPLPRPVRRRGVRRLPAPAGVADADVRGRLRPLAPEPARAALARRRRRPRDARRGRRPGRARGAARRAARS